MIDIHAHLLPGVDDGPSSWEEVLDMVKVAKNEGIRAMVATSHMMSQGTFNNTRDELLPLVDELRSRIQEAGLDMGIHAGGEVYMTPDVGLRYERGELLTYCDAGHYMLVEMPSGEIPRYALDVLFDLKVMGVTPIVAHPERNHDVMEKPSRAAALVEQGALLQVNASSLSGGRVRQAAQYLIEHGLVHFLATDAHGVFSRRPRLRKFVELVESWVGEEAVERMVKVNPAAVLAGETVETSMPVVQKRTGPVAWFGNLLQRRPRTGDP